MQEYHKIKTVFKRNPHGIRNLLEGEYSLPEFEYLKDNKWVFTEKIDGMNIRVIRKNMKILFGGKTDNANIPPKLLQNLSETFSCIDTSLSVVFDENDVCFYGEGYGVKIQKGGGNYGPLQKFILFDVKINNWWLKRKDVEDVGKKLGIDVVPIIGEGTLQDMIEMAREGIKSTWGDFEAEGIVARPKVELKARNGDRIITKIKCKDFKKG